MQFNVITTSLTVNFDLNHYLVIAVTLGLVLFAGSGGVKRIGDFSTTIIPFFIVLYASMGGWVLYQNYEQIPSILFHVLGSAFTGEAAVGGFMGSSLLVVISQGVRRGAYTGDIGVGYPSIIYSESGEKNIEKIASLVLFGAVIDTFIVCTTSVLLILATGVWTIPADPSMLVQMALAQHFPHTQYFMPVFLFLLGYATIYAYFCVGMKSAEYLSPKYGKWIFYAYAIAAFVIFSFVNTLQAQTIMAIVNALLLVLNSWGIWRLRHEISYTI